MRSSAARTAVRVVALLGVAACAAVLLAAVVVPRLLGAETLTVLSGSMAPTIPAGAVVVVQRVDVAEVDPGDVVTYQVRSGAGSPLVTHRVVSVQRVDGRILLTTQGDANERPDREPVPGEAVRGRVLYDVPLVGQLREQVPARGALLVLAVVGLVGYAAYQVVEARREARPRSRPVPLPAGDAPSDVLLAVLPPGSGVRLPHVLDAWQRSVTPPLAPPVLDRLPAGEVALVATGPAAGLDALADVLQPLRPLSVRRVDATAGRPVTDVAVGDPEDLGPHAGRSARDVGPPADPSQSPQTPALAVVGLVVTVALGLGTLADTGTTLAALSDTERAMSATVTAGIAESVTALTTSSGCFSEEQLATLDPTAEELAGDGLTPEELERLGLTAEEVPEACLAPPPTVTEAPLSSARVTAPRSDSLVAPAPDASTPTTTPTDPTAAPVTTSAAEPGVGADVPSPDAETGKAPAEPDASHSPSPSP